MADYQFSHGYALLIGVGGDLPVTVKDAEAIYNILINPSRCAYPREQVQLLIEGDADRASILANLEKLAEQAKADPEATVVVYFSGHGGRVPEYYLIPYGCDFMNIPTTAISGTEFTEKLQGIRAKKLLVLLDCCHAGGIADVKGFTKAPAPEELLDMLSQSSGRVAIASSRQDEVSYGGTAYSEFTRALLEGLSGYGASEKDGYARVLDVAMYVGRWVPNRTNDRQHPIIKVHNLEDSFVVAYYAGGAKDPVPLPGFRPPRRRIRSRGEMEIELLKSLLKHHLSDPGRMVSSQVLGEELGYSVDELNRLILPLVEKELVRADYVGKLAVLRITDLGRRLVEGQ